MNETLRKSLGVTIDEVDEVTDVLFLECGK